jgi:hypothetical protein
VANGYTLRNITVIANPHRWIDDDVAEVSEEKAFADLRSVWYLKAKLYIHAFIPPPADHSYGMETRVSIAKAMQGHETKTRMRKEYAPRSSNASLAGISWKILRYHFNDASFL